jgi:hypothetical protein
MRSLPKIYASKSRPYVLNFFFVTPPFRLLNPMGGYKETDRWGGLLYAGGQFFKRIFAPTRQARAYAMVAFGWVGAYAQVDAYASFKKLASGVEHQSRLMLVALAPRMKIPFFRPILQIHIHTSTENVEFIWPC